MLFVNDILVDELRDGVDVDLERWWEALEPVGFRIGQTETKIYGLQLQWG